MCAQRRSRLAQSSRGVDTPSGAPVGRIRPRADEQRDVVAGSGVGDAEVEATTSRKGGPGARREGRGSTPQRRRRAVAAGLHRRRVGKWPSPARPVGVRMIAFSTSLAVPDRRCSSTDIPAAGSRSWCRDVRAESAEANEARVDDAEQRAFLRSSRRQSRPYTPRPHGLRAQSPASALAGRRRVALQCASTSRKAARARSCTASGSETFLSEIAEPAAFANRQLSMESLYEYGSRVGVWRSARVRAASPAADGVRGAWRRAHADVAGGVPRARPRDRLPRLRWISISARRGDRARAHGARGGELQRLTGERPRGWYNRPRQPEHAPAGRRARRLEYDSDHTATSCRSGSRRAPRRRPRAAARRPLHARRQRHALRLVEGLCQGDDSSPTCATASTSARRGRRGAGDDERRPARAPGRAPGGCARCSASSTRRGPRRRLGDAPDRHRAALDRGPPSTRTPRRTGRRTVIEPAAAGTGIAAEFAALPTVYEHLRRGSPPLRATSAVRDPRALKRGLVEAVRDAAATPSSPAAGPPRAREGDGRGTLTASSTVRADGAGADRGCTPAELARIGELNAAYLAKFGFSLLLRPCAARAAAARGKDEISRLRAPPRPPGRRRTRRGVAQTSTDRRDPSRRALRRRARPRQWSGRAEQLAVHSDPASPSAASSRHLPHRRAPRLRAPARR